MSTAAERQRRSRKHRTGDHSLCRAGHCPDAVTDVTASHETVTKGDHETAETSQDVTIDGDNITATQRARARETKALELMASGWSKTAISVELGYRDHSGVSRAVSRALSRQATMAGDQLRGLADAELEELRVKLHVLLNLPGVSADSAVKVIGEIRKLQERRSKLHGLDAGNRPSEQQASATGFVNNFDSPKGFFLVVDGGPARHVLPHDRLILNPTPGAGYLQPPIPSVVIDPLLFPGTGIIRKIIADGGLSLDGMFFRLADEDLTDEFLSDFHQAHDDASKAEFDRLMAEKGLT